MRLAELRVRQGRYLFGPRDIPHRFTTGPDGCRMLFILTPGGFEGLLREIGRMTEQRTLPPADAPPPSEEEIGRMTAAIQAHGCELL
jgi:hypothetical protein